MNDGAPDNRPSVVDDTTTISAVGEELVFDVDREEIEFYLKSNKTGNVEKYVVREMTGLEAGNYQDWFEKQVKKDSNGNISGFVNNADMMSKLPSMCVWKDGKLLKASDISAFSNSIVQKMIKLCRKVNGLDDTKQVEDEEVKK
jgi:hypothetical protein